MRHTLLQGDVCGDKYISYIVSGSVKMETYKVQTNEIIYT